MMFIASSPPPSQFGLLDQPFVLVRQQMALDLADGVHRHGDDNQQACSAEIERHRELPAQNSGRMHTTDR